MSRAAGTAGLRNAHRLWAVLAQAQLSTGEPPHPWRQETSLQAPCPVLLLILVWWDNTTARCNLNEPDRSVDEEVGADTGNQAIGDRVGKGHDCNGEESRDGIAQVTPVDVLGRSSHERTDNDERAASGPGRNRGKDGREEDGYEEAETRKHGSKSSLASLGNTSTRLNVRSDGRAAHERANRDTNSVDRVCDGRVFEILSALIDGATEASHGVEGTGA